MLFWIMVDVGGAGRKESKSSAAAALETSFLFFFFEGWKEIFFFSVRTLSRYSDEKIFVSVLTHFMLFFMNPTESNGVQ